MRYVYYEPALTKVFISPDASTEHGQLLGVISEDDFANIRTQFLVQALFHRARITIGGITIETVIGPANYP
jgi:hypothetical protein